MKPKNKIFEFIIDKFWLTAAVLLAFAFFFLFATWHLVNVTKFGQWLITNLRLVLAICFAFFSVIVFFLICLIKWDWNEKDDDNF